jgi:hypothetical protein
VQHLIFGCIGAASILEVECMNEKENILAGINST